MGQIKSALEIALERTESVKGDKSSINHFEAKQRGKKLANEFLGSPGGDPGKEVNLGEALKKASKEDAENLRQGIFDVLVSQINLPVSQEDMSRLERAGRGLQEVIKDSRFAALYKQFLQLLGRSLGEAARYEEAIRQQYGPKLRQKEEELSRRLGRQVQLDPFQDPDFTACYNQHMNALKENYQGAADQVRGEAAQLFHKK
jgi:hypothetical protein